MFVASSGLAPGQLPFLAPVYPMVAAGGNSTYYNEQPISPSNPCLPRNSVCIVVGNNRTKKALVGQRAIVRRAVGLGGWHHCVLEADGSEVKLQRNALHVLEYGPLVAGAEAADPSGSSTDTEAREPQIDMLTAPPSLSPSTAYAPPPLQLELPLFKKASSARARHNPLIKLHKLDSVSLKRYRRVFCLDAEVAPAAANEALLSAVERHFTSQEVDEGPVLVQFVTTLQRRYRRQRLLAAQFPHAGALQDDDAAEGAGGGGYWQRPASRQSLYK